MTGGMNGMNCFKQVQKGLKQGNLGFSGFHNIPQYSMFFHVFPWVQHGIPCSWAWLSRRAHEVVSKTSSYALLGPQAPSGRNQSTGNKNDLMTFDCLILFDIVWYCLILFDIVWYCLILFDIVWYCLILFDIVWYCLILFDTKNDRFCVSSAAHHWVPRRL